MTFDPITAKNRLIEIIKEKSFRTGDFTLASGKKSPYYFNLKPTMLAPEGAYLIARLLLEEIKGMNADMAGGLELGAVPIASSLTAISHEHGAPMRAFIIRKEQKGHGTQSRIEGLLPEEEFAGKQVLILEDVTTTGGSALKAIDVVKAQGASIAGVYTVLDRKEGAGAAFKEKNIKLNALLELEDFING